MRALIYSRSCVMFSAVLGTALRLSGCRVEHCAPQQWRGEITSADVVFIKGARHMHIVSAYLSAGIPVFVFDWGYMRRVNRTEEAQTGHWQISYAGLNRPPTFDVPSDRFDALGLSVERGARSAGNRALLIGQMPGDAAVGGTCHATWLREKQIELQDLGFDVVYREHPRGGIKMPHLPSASGPLIDEMRASRVVVTYNSNTGHDALLAGVPVLCDTGAAYSALSGAKVPSTTRRREYFNRLAYGQWRIDELPRAVDFLKTEWLPRLRA